jgi:signal recognition particle receptor subunit beta
MASVNPLSRELVFKVVYYGPGLCGKTTTLEHLHATAKPEHRGKLVSLATPVDRTLYFDFLPVRLPAIRGMKVRLQLFTVPGQVYFNATRKLVLTGADGVVFVSDSQAARADSNLESFENLKENLAEQGRVLALMPIVFQHNKRDLPDLLPIEELDHMLNPFGAPSLPTCAVSGEGIYESLEQIANGVLAAFKDKLPDSLEGAIDANFSAIEGGLSHALRDASAGERRPPKDVVSLKLPVPTPALTLPPELAPSVAPPTDAEAEDARLEALRAPAAPAFAELSPEDVSDAPDSDRSGVADAGRDRGDSAGAGRDHGDSAGAGRDPAREAHAPAATSFVEAPPVARGEVLAPNAGGAGFMPAAAPPAGASFAELWPDNERDVVREVEGAIRTGKYWRAIELCDTLVSRILAGAAGLFGSTDAPRDPGIVPLLLGLDGRRYLAFRNVVREARTDGLITSRDALAAFAFAIDARLARTSIH